MGISKVTTTDEHFQSETRNEGWGTLVMVSLEARDVVLGP